MHIAVIGAGFTGTMVAVHLVGRGQERIRVTLLERAPRFAAGVAYSTTHACHLLNVPAGRMSAFPDDEEHFLRWARDRSSSVHGGTFVPRRMYALYLADILERAASANAGSGLHRINAEAVSIATLQDHGLEVGCASGAPIRADIVVLAIGNYPPADPPCETPAFYGSDRYHQDPWAPGALDFAEDDDVLLLGTGLTMIDVAVALREREYKGSIHAISRRGLLPQSHREIAAAPPHIPPPSSWELWPSTATGMCREIRGEVARAERLGVDWRDVITSLRPITCDLWRSLPSAEKRRFLTHLRPYFETHRHRTAPEIGQLVERLRAQGQLRVVPGRAVRYEHSCGVVRVQVRRRGSDSPESLCVQRVINCTGPDTDLSRARDPLVGGLRDQGMIRPDPLGLGLDSDENGRVINSHGHPHERLFLAGPLRRGLLWENIAVPELREEAHSLAQRILCTGP